MKSLKLVVLAALVSGAVARADQPKAVDAPECVNIVKQCETAGFKPDKHLANGKGLWKDCVDQVVAGKTITGVTATVAEGQACKKAKRAIHAANKVKSNEVNVK